MGKLKKKKKKALSEQKNRALNSDTRINVKIKIRYLENAYENV